MLLFSYFIVHFFINNPKFWPQIYQLFCNNHYLCNKICENRLHLSNLENWNNKGPAFSKKMRDILEGVALIFLVVPYWWHRFSCTCFDLWFVDLRLFLFKFVFSIHKDDFNWLLSFWTANIPIFHINCSKWHVVLWHINILLRFIVFPFK